MSGETAPKRYDIVPVPVMTLFVATDAQKRISLSADVMTLFKLEPGHRVALGYVADERAIAIRQTLPVDLTAATVDKRGYLSARPFFNKTRLEAVGRRYNYATTQDDWLVFIAEEEAR
ncbi:hypothetical protein [Cohnella silvisoli]|uniref:Uncharacterized protein n=1 Tax=Cohnella silvisoli TaxID=2873699 RepID=A0ABV1KZ20_9BACL|nr:hypothetical protein [Cohnella silvisoli]MCD9024342.1 hypothetical protein [Cohnella silvisoli]